MHADDDDAGEWVRLLDAPVQNNYAVIHYRLGYVQVWNLDIQRTLPQGIVANIGYNGAKGGVRRCCICASTLRRSR